MQPTNDDGLRLETEAILRGALRSLEMNRVKRLIGDTSNCLGTDSIRRLAAAAPSGTVHEQRHMLICVRCRARVIAFQRAKSTTPKQLCEAALQAARTAPVPLMWVMFAEQQSRQIFDLLMRGCDAAQLGSDSWLITSAVADELRNARSGGATDAISAHLMATLLISVAAASHDVLSPWSSDFDAAWPMFELLRETAKEAAHAGDATREQFVVGYAHIAAGAPTLLRAVLVDGIENLANGNAAEGDEDLAPALRSEIDMADVSNETQALLGAMGEQTAELERVIGRQAEPDDIAELVAATLRALFEGLLASSTEDPVDLLLQLRTIRHYLATLIAATRHFTAEQRQPLLHAAARPLLDYASDSRSSAYLAIEASRALMEESLIYANVLSTMLAVGRPELTNGVVVGLRRAYQSTGSGRPGSMPRFERHGGAWSFTGAPTHPLYATATAVARLVEVHPALMNMIGWFNHRFEARSVTLENTK